MLLAVSGYSKAGGPDLSIILVKGGTATGLVSVETRESPSFLLPCEGGFYAAHELGDCVKISRWAVHTSAAEVVLLHKKTMTLPGHGLCHLLDTGGALVGANWGSGEVFAVDYALTTELWRHTPIGENPHAHGSAMLSKDVFATCDMGLDLLCFYKAADFSSIGQLKLPKGTGPRQLIPLFGGRFLVVLENTPGVMLCGFSRGNCQILDHLKLGEPGRCFPGGGALLESGQLLLPLRGRKQLLCIAVLNERLVITKEYITMGDWVRALTPLPNNTVLLAQQKAGCIERLTEKGEGDTLLSFPAPAYILPLTNDKDDCK